MRYSKVEKKQIQKLTKRWFRFRTIKSALFIKIGLVAFIPLLAICLFNFFYYKQDSMQSTQNIQSMINQHSATKLNLFVMAQQFLFREFSKHSSPIFLQNNEYTRSSKRRGLQTFLEKMSSLSIFNHLFIVDKKGDIYAYLGDLSKDKVVGSRFNHPGKPYFPYFGQRKQFNVAGTSVTGHLMLLIFPASFSHPYYLVGISDFSRVSVFLQDELNELTKRDLVEGTLFIVDLDKKESILSKGKDIALSAILDWDKIDFNHRRIQHDGRTWYGDKEPVSVGLHTYFLGTIVTEKDILFKSTRMLKITLGIVALSVLVLMSVIMLVGTGFIQPLQQLEKRLKLVSKGDYSGEIPILSEDEFGELSHSANIMTRDLVKSTQAIRRHIRALNKEQKRSDELLLNILPESIADRLKNGEENIADSFSNVTILFSDIVGFTTFSSQLTAHELVVKLNDLYSRFDDLLDIYNIEKIKTIGDALMLVSGAPISYNDHAQEMSHVALAMMDIVSEFNEIHDLSLELRIGLHSGSVVAGVIGKRKFVYDLWGDTVNVASRMESHGVPGRIQLSHATYLLIKESFLAESRGKIDIKGKGLMATYLLERPIFEEK